MYLDILRRVIELFEKDVETWFKDTNLIEILFALIHVNFPPFT